MNISTQRALDLWLGQILCALLSLWYSLGRKLGLVKNPLPFAQQPTHNTVSECTPGPRILVILLSEMGSAVLAQGLFDTLKQQFQNADLHVLQLKKNQAVLQLLGFVPPQNLHSLDDSSALTFMRDLWATLGTLRRLRLNGVVDCELFSRISALISYLCGAPLRAGFTPHTQEGLYRGNWFNVPVAYNPYQHIRLQFTVLARVLCQALKNPHTQGSPTHRLVLPQQADSTRPLHLKQDELQAFQNRLGQDFPVFFQTPHKARVLLYVSGGALPIRAWPQEHYSELARQLLGHGCAVALIGLPEDKAQAQQVLAQTQHPACLDLTGYTQNLRELLLLFHSSQLLITNDGGPGHFASLTPIHSIVFFGPETSRLYGPTSPRATVLESGMACSPCLTAYNHRKSFCDGDNQCLKTIHPDTVLALALQKIDMGTMP